MSKPADHSDSVPQPLDGMHEDAADLAMVHAHLPMAVFVIGPDRKVRGANRRACTLFGHGEAAPVGLLAGAAMRCLNHLSDPRGCGHAPDCRECCLRQTAQQAFESRCSIHDVEGTIPVEGEHGTVERHLLADFVHVGHPEPGRLLVYLRDVTERKLQQERLRESELRFRRLHEHLPLGYFCLDRDGCYRDANPAWLAILGCTDDALLGRPFLAHVTADDVPRFHALQNQLASEQGVHIELTLRRDDGRPAVVYCVGRADAADAGCDGMVHWVAADVSERRDLEDQLRHAQKMDALGRLAAGVAHDFNNQLTVMRGYCDLLIDGIAEGHPTRLAAQQIRLAAERARSTTSQLLAFSRRGACEPRVVDLNQTLEELHHPVAKMIGESIRMRLEPAPRLPRVEVDPSGLQQALFNLIINARDAQPDGGVIVLRTGRDGAGSVFLEVADAGRGMDAALAERVWEPFFTTKDAGTGLGLAMVKSFVEQSGGSVSLASKPGAGTTARITLPAVTEAGAPAQQGQASRVRGGRRGRILVVEDDDEVRRVVATILRQVGHDVVAARGPADAVQLAAGAAVPFDLLLTDVVMPDMRGEDLADLLSGRGQVRRIMFMSGYGSPLREAGDPPLVTKPFSAAQLISTVAALLAPEVEPSPTAATIAPTARVEAHR